MRARKQLSPHLTSLKPLPSRASLARKHRHSSAQRLAAASKLTSQNSPLSHIVFPRNHPEYTEFASQGDGTLLGSLRPHLLDDEDRPVPNVLLQLIQPHNAQALNDSPPLDMRVDQVICTSEISCSLLGLATLYPGLTTLVSNLLSSSTMDVR